MVTYFGMTYLQTLMYTKGKGTIISYTYENSVLLGYCTVSLVAPITQDTVQYPRTGTTTTLMESLKTHILMLSFNEMDPHMYEHAQQVPFFLYSFFQNSNCARTGSVKTV